MAKRYDAIVIGAGHNGLVSAAYLARAGRRVLVLERRHVVGGAAVTEELYPGFKFSVASYVVSLFRPHIIRELNLTRHGMQLIPLECSFTPHLEGPGLVRWPDPHRTRREVSHFSQKDAEIYPEFSLAMTKMGFFVKRIIDSPPPDVGSLNPAELSRLTGLMGHLRDLGPDMVELHAQLLTMSAVDFLQMWFESDALLAPMSCSGIIGTFLGVRSPGTAYVLLHHYMGEIDGAFRSWGFSKGGTGGLSLAIASAAQAFGAEIKLSAPVSRIVVKNGRAKGVVLENGDEYNADVVLSCADPRRTFISMVGEPHFDTDFLSQLRRYKYRGSSGKVNLALDRLPDFTCRPGDGPHIRGDIAIAPSLEYLERAFDDAKYGEFSRRPYLNVVIPSLVDPSVAPPGKHVMSCFVQYAPYNRKGGAETWPAHREAFGDAVVDTLAEYCPGLKESILYRQVLTPWDLEQELGLTEGNIFQGELSLEQLLFLRPAAGWSRYRTPVKNLWLCGSGAHPGGGIMGSPGELCAKAVLESREV
ncbi:MAG: NAD(P)/FAD-dependent oxidoreductase [Candidatus Krumholzibacteria bacterium]|nr:NAD(P)/FAD-dependent oxidoreductase [Candidatus Krumholzibacteria bacterium]MDH4335865.1 NAD(P)/FAD-dependent oxidoreductase [Candidatus Krumholzibacteria bacterium]MDH5270357.1 NAD(P)/FAD-dependent oxidoreductase [Candidatus Krumholzibacteria bacterium]MDH5627854.1 NAD(P)/FAD-dependent oxidoreductase [Candidatus Krumholzibacteria bacterium]